MKIKDLEVAVKLNDELKKVYGERVILCETTSVFRLTILINDIMNSETTTKLEFGKIVKQLKEILVVFLKDRECAILNEIEKL